MGKLRPEEEVRAGQAKTLNTLDSEKSTRKDPEGREQQAWEADGRLVWLAERYQEEDWWEMTWEW